MSEEERAQLITAISLQQKYAMSYLEKLTDRELVELYDRHLSI